MMGSYLDSNSMETIGKTDTIATVVKAGVVATTVLGEMTGTVVSSAILVPNRRSTHRGSRGGRKSQTRTTEHQVQALGVLMKSHEDFMEAAVEAVMKTN